jgi:hypothetical protein
MQRTKVLIRQGNILFSEIDYLPEGRRKKCDDGVIDGAHVLAPEDRNHAQVLEIGGELFVHVSKSAGPGVAFQHRNRGPVTLRPGNYAVRLQREYDWGGRTRPFRNPVNPCH